MSLSADQSSSGNRFPQAILDLTLILLLALLLRLVTYNGAFGSDDLTYFQRAAELAHGEWTSANYNGALRYGFNLPAAGFILLFGESFFVANLWPLGCSLVEISAVFLFASAAVNRRTGVYAALLLASAPLHIAVATRIHADPVVSMFTTVGFVLMYFGAQHRRPMLLFAAGLSIGGIFWAKELAAVTWFAFLPMLWFFRKQWRNCFYVMSGVVLMMIMHGLLMLAIAGDPLHLVKVVLGAVKRNFIDGGQGDDSAEYYLRFLFVNLRHTGLLAFFAVASVLTLPRLMKQDTQLRNAFIYVLIWWLGLILLLSIFPVSLSPLRFPMKQSNYITLFLAPTALLAGLAIAALQRSLGNVALTLCLVLGIFLGALQQADYRVFTANTKALATFAAQNPRTMIIGSTNNSSLGSVWARMENPGEQTAIIDSYRDLSENVEITRKHLQEADAIFAVLDLQTINWMSGSTPPVTTPLPCWQYEKTLEFTGLGLGNQLAKLIGEVFRGIRPLSEAMDRLARPQRADVYRVNGHNVLCSAG